MKLSFCSKQVKTNTFLDLCNKTANYGFSGFEIYDAVSEMTAHSDSIFNPQSQAGAKRKLVNRHIAVSAIKYPEKVDKSVDVKALSNYVELCATASCNNLIIELGEIDDLELFKVVLTPVVCIASKLGVSILIETRGVYADTNKILDVINVFESAVIGVSWDIRETFFTAKETADQTIQTLGAYVNYVRIGDMRDGKKVLIGDGELPVEEFMNALKSLNYDGYVCAEWNDEITDEDIVLTHFTNFIDRITGDNANAKPIYYNRDKTGTFPWKKYEVIDLTFSEVLDEMVARYPDQYAFKYTTLDYTRTYQEFRDDVDRVAAALISLGVKPGHHVAIWATNVPEWFLTFWATVKIGAVLVTVNTAYKIHETEYLLRQSDTHT